MYEAKSVVFYSIDELKQMILAPEYGPVIFSNGWPIHLEMNPLAIAGEAFRLDPENENIECSNLGRIRHNKETILQQYIEKIDYLYVQIPGEQHPTLVYQIVFRTWCNNIERKPGISYEIHHITNNGFDNRPSNLVLMGKNDHSKIKTPRAK